MTTLDGVYGRLPVGLQHAACSLTGWWIARRRYDREFWHLLSAAEERARWTSEEWSRFRDERLRAFLERCARAVPYYRELFAAHGVRAERLRALDDLRSLPVLTKSLVQDRLWWLRNREVPQRQLLRAHTSGTTGAGLRFFITWSAAKEQWAVWWRYRRWHGVPFDAWCGYFGGRSVVPVAVREPPFWRDNRPMRQIVFSAYHMSPNNLGAYVAELRRRRPPWLHGYPSLLSLLAAYLLDRGLDLGYQVRWVTTGAENLLAHQKDLMQRAFGVRPRQHYGLAEAVANFSECEEGLLHVDEDFAAVEFLPDEASGAYRIVGTNLSNLATPLVRYDTGDLARLRNSPCRCGRPGRVVERVDGRCEDYVELPNGARIGRLDHVFKDLMWVREAQIVQRRDGSLQVRLVPRQKVAAREERRLLQELRDRLGDEVPIEIVYADRLERGPTGKLRFVVSERAPISEVSMGVGKR